MSEDRNHHIPVPIPVQFKYRHLYHTLSMSTPRGKDRHLAVNMYLTVTFTTTSITVLCMWNGEITVWPAGPGLSCVGGAMHVRMVTFDLQAPPT